MDKKFLNKVLGQLDRETTIDYEKERIHHAFPSLSYITSDFPNSLSPATAYYFSRHCMDIYGLNKEEIDYVWVEYINNIKDKLSNGINESHVYKTSEDDFTNRVVSMLDQPPYLPILSPMGLTEEDYERVFKKMYGEDVRVKYFKEEEIELRVSSKIGTPRPLYVEILEHDGENYWEKWDYFHGEDVWRRYVDSEGDRRLRSKNGIIIYDDHIEDCCPEELEDGFYPPLHTDINENALNNEWYYQYVFDSKYLSRVLEQLLSETKIEWDTQENGISIKVGWDPYIGYQKNVSYPLFRKHCKEVYSLKQGEISDIFTLYMMDMKKRLRKKDDVGNRLTEEIMSPDISKQVTHKGKLNFIDRITDMMMDETYVTDIEPTHQNSDWYEEGMRKIYFYKGDNPLGRDDEEGVIKPGRSFSDFGNSYSQDIFSAVKSHLRRFGATNIEWNMEIYIWTEYLYRLREKYFGGGEGRPLVRIKKY